MESAPSQNAVWMLKSTYYPDLRRRILTVLSLPNDSFYEVEYDSHWIDDELKNDMGVLKGKDAYVIFWDYGTPQFYPLRLCKIQDVQSGEPYKFILKIGKLLAFKEQQTESNFNSFLSTSLKGRGFISESSGSFGLSKLILACKDASMSDILRQVEGDDDKDWQRIVKHLTETKPIDSTPQFTQSLFFKFQLLNEEQLGPVKIKDGKYKLTARKGYLFRLRAFQPHWKNFKPNESAKMLFGFDDKILRHIGARLLRMPLGQRIYSKDFKITAAPMFGAKSALKFERETDEFNAASYDVPLSMPIQSRQVIFKFLPFPVGLLLVGLGEEITKVLISWGLALPSFAITLAITLLGTFLCAISLKQFD
jgi:hypothetical protein